MLNFTWVLVVTVTGFGIFVLETDRRFLEVVESLVFNVVAIAGSEVIVEGGEMGERRVQLR